MKRVKMLIMAGDEN